MARITILRYSLFCATVVFLCSCCSLHQEEDGSVIHPEWEVEIPTGSSSSIYYDGLPNLPAQGDIMIAHTTVLDEGVWKEDNRLCAIDIQTGKILWYFPSILNERHNCFFDKKGYIEN